MKHDIRMTAQKIARRLELVASKVYRRSQALEPLRLRALSGPSESPHLDEDSSRWEAVPPRNYWGGPDLNFVLRGSFRVPQDFDPELPVALFLPLGEAGEFSHPEALVYIDQQPYATTDRHHQEFLLAPEHCDGRVHRLELHGWTGSLGLLGQPAGSRVLMGESALVQIDPPTRDLLALGRTALQAANLLDDLEPAKTRLYTALDTAFARLDTLEPLAESFYASVPQALQLLRDGVAAAGAPLEVEVIAAGHAHIDVAWLWTLGQTRRKVGRTFHTALRQMEQFPRFHFTQSQPQLYEYARQDYPELFDAIRQRVEEGRWEPIGGMWVEADCNLSGHESLVRQLLLGRSYFRRHFGVGAESPVLWLPDVFGYTWSLPQLIKQAGLEYFFTIKIGWNQTNQLPYDSFWWQGLDGTRVLTHFSTTPDQPWSGQPATPDLRNYATYNAQLSAFGALGSWAKLKHKETQRVMLMSYGYGDGGGGPTREMNENAEVLGAFPSLPRLRQGKVIEFFRRLEAESGTQLPTWNAELYLEIHRGTYTTQSRSKRNNRKSEFLLHDAEFLAGWAGLLEPEYAYPHQLLQRAWELLCLNQFHDIIPGSSIGAVYAESEEQYAEVGELRRAVRDGALEVLRARFGGDLLLVNPTGFTRRDLAFWAGSLPEGQGFSGAQTQPVEGGTLVGGLELPPYSITPLSFAPARLPGEPALQAQPDRLENDRLRVELNPQGDITRIYDKQSRREVLAPGTVGNQFQAFEDRPLNWDAWDVDVFYDDKQFLAQPAESVRVLENGPLRATLEVRRRILSSTYIQRISLSAGSPRLDFDTEIDWRERHVLLKVAFPVDILSPVATHEIQWGHVQRPTHRNTSWDWARFETCAQKWVDMSEGGYGVALLNDCKYGHDVQANVIRLSLLRSPTWPDPQADQGTHRFSYSLLPHPGLTPSAIASHAYALNDPALVVAGDRRPPRPPASLIQAPAGVVLETVKAAEDGEGLIVRLYECDRRRGWVSLRTDFPLRAAYRANLLEETQEELEVHDQEVRLYLTPFQIATLRLIPA